MKNAKKTLRVNLAANSYNITFGAPIFKNSVFKNASKVLVVTDKNVAKLYLQSVTGALKKSGINATSAIIPAGEEGKSIKALSYLYDKALEQGLDRKSVVLALGGGVVGDVGGFFASTYMRGVSYVQMPTTLLAMVDSSVGGKTAVNLKGGKNIAGTFYQPKAVYIDTEFLSTLELRQIKNGLAEVVKYAVSQDAKFFDYLEKIFDSGIIKQTDFLKIIYHSCAYKAQVVCADEKETKGIREVLNFGHTLAHAVETYTGYKKYLHGEAVIFGMVFETLLSVEAGLCSKEVFSKIKSFLEDAGFETVPDIKIDAQRLLSLMKKDKKSVGGIIKFTLLNKLGQAKCRVEVADKLVLKTLQKYLKGQI